MNKIKETKNKNEFAGKVRERRQRKMKVDQQKIQETLDAKKNEEELISKYLKKQAQEQNDAMLKWRQQRCEEVDTLNRRKKAAKMQNERDERNAMIEQKMRENSKAIAI